MLKEVTIVLNDGIDFSRFAEKCRRKCRIVKRASGSRLLAKGYIMGVEDALNLLKEELEIDCKENTKVNIRK